MGLATIRRAELAQDATSLTAANDLVIRRTFEAADIEFIDENGGGPGLVAEAEISEIGQFAVRENAPALSSLTKMEEGQEYASRNAAKLGQGICLRRSHVFMRSNSRNVGASS